MKLKMSYTFIESGAFDGFPAIFLSLTEGKDTSLEQAIMLIRDSMKQMNIKSQVVVLDSRKGVPNDEAMSEVIKLIDYLLTNGYYLVHYISGKERPSYVRMGGLVKTFITDVDWMGFETNELHWTPQSKDATEPQAPPPAARFIHLNKKVNMRYLMDFILECEGVWIAALPPRENVEVILYG